MNQKRMSAKVSFIVAMYNVAAYIEQCARSLFEQTEKDLEFIFVDDASPDNCTEIVRRVMGEYPERVPQVKIVRHAENKRIIETRRDGLSAATGEYVTFIDGDDYVEPRHAELAYGKAAETGADMVLYDLYGYSKDGVQVVQAVSPIAIQARTLCSVFLRHTTQKKWSICKPHCIITGIIPSQSPTPLTKNAC